MADGESDGAEDHEGGEETVGLEDDEGDEVTVGGNECWLLAVGPGVGRLEVEGSEDGCDELEGSELISLEGEEDGCDEGWRPTDARDDGSLEGEEDGWLEGCELVSLEGEEDGWLEGCELGLLEGDGDGWLEGSELGSLEGEGDGCDEGSLKSEHNQGGLLLVGQPFIIFALTPK